MVEWKSRLRGFTLLLLCIGALPVLLVGWVMFWMVGAARVVPPLSPVLAYFHGVPGDALFHYNFKDGLGWRYCRDLPSGRLTVTELSTFLEHGRRCEAVPSRRREVMPSLEHPVLSVSSVYRNGSIRFATPRPPDFNPSGACPYTLSADYISRTRALLSEANALADLPDDRREALLVAEASVASFSAGRLQGDSGSCRLSPPERPDPLP